jgi:hypothetical protein
MLLYQLTRPIAFRQIKHPALRVINIFIPAGLTLLVVFVYVLLPVKPKLFGDDSITSNALLFITVLPGFFIAALAAVATFPSTDLDEIMPNPAPTLVMRTGGKSEAVELTYRVFLCHLFSYLTVLSFAGFVVGVASDLTAGSILFWLAMIPSPTIHSLVSSCLHLVYLLLFAWLFANLIVATVYGLYFLVERIHRPYS